MPAYRRLSESPLWAAQRRFYERAGIDAWRSGTVPHHVTSNVALATAYARIIAGFARDTARRAGPGAAHDAGRREPLDVVELGAGSGRFAFLLLRALEALGRRAPAIRYVMTDVAESTIDFWRRHEALAPYVRAGRLGFARVDAGSLAVRGRARRQGRVSRLVVIANYVFSGLPHDAFVLRAGRTHEYRVAVRHGPRTAAGLGRSRREDEVSLTWRAGPRVTDPYADADLDAILHAQVNTATAGPALFPVGALRALDQLRGLADDVLVLVADRGTEEMSGAITSSTDLGVARHGSISFPVNFPVLRASVKRREGRSLAPSRPEALLHVEAFLMGRRRDWPATRRAYREAMKAGGPAALYRERREIAADRTPRTPAALLRLMRRCGPDPRVVAECLRPLWPHLAGAGPRLRRDAARAALAAWPNHYHLGESHDVAFDLGLLLYATRSYAGARTLFEASLELHGDDAASWWNLGQCQLALGRAQAARAAFRRAQRLAPGRHVAGLATVKTDRASQRGR